MAWLNAKPQPDQRSKAADPKFKRPELSRSEQMKKDGVPVRMPPNAAPEIVQRLIEIGLTESGAVGASVLSWQTLDAWQRVTCIEIPPWEARLYRHLSTEYLSQLRKSESVNCPAPWRTQVTKREQELELAQLKAALGW